MANKKTTKTRAQSYVVGDPMAAEFTEAAKAWLPPWAQLLGEIRDGWKSWLESEPGRQLPVELLNRCVVALCSYPVDMGRIGMEHRAVRGIHEVALAMNTLDQLAVSARVALASEAHRQGLDVAAVESGFRALQRTYAPNPIGNGSASGVDYPKAGIWPECMTVADLAKLSPDVRGRLDALADALDRMNHSAGVTVAEAAGKKVVAQSTDDDFIFRQDGGSGGFWKLRFDGIDLPHVPNSKGMAQLRRLLTKRADPVPARELHYISDHIHPDAIKDNSGALADTHGTEFSREFVYDDPGAARKIIQGRLDDIEAELAEQSTTLETRDELHVEQSKLTKAIKEINATIKTGGPQLKRDDKRTAVKGTIDRAIAMIGKTTQCPELERHLSGLIHTGATCIYKGDHDWLTE